MSMSKMANRNELKCVQVEKTDSLDWLPWGLVELGGQSQAGQS